MSAIIYSLSIHLYIVAIEKKKHSYSNDFLHILCGNEQYRDTYGGWTNNRSWDNFAAPML